MALLKSSTTQLLRKGPSSRRPVPLYLSDERPGSISITLNVHFAEDDVTLKVAVCRCFTVGQAASFALKRLNTIFHKPIADESATYSLAIPVEGGEPTLLSSSLTLKEAHLDDEDSVHLVKEPPHVVLRIFVPYGDKKNTTVTMRFLPSTRTHQVIEKLCQRFQTMQIGNLDAFMLYVEERAGDMYTCMQENEPISSYNISNRLMFRSVGSPTAIGMKLNVRVMEDSSDSAAAPGQSIIFDPNGIVLSALRRVRRLLPVPENCGLFLQRKETEFLRMKETLGLREYGLNEGDYICVRRLYYDYSVTLPDGTEDHLSLEPSRTVGEVVDLLRFNYPNPDGATDMALYCRGDAMPLTDALYSWDTKDIPLVFKKEPKRIGFCHKGTTEYFELDFARPLHELPEFEAVFYAFGLTMPRVDEYELAVGTAADDMRLDPTRSLDSQGMIPGVLLFLTMKLGAQRAILEREEDEAQAKNENVKRSIWEEQEGPGTIEFDRANPQAPTLTLGTINQLVCKLADDSTHPDFLKAFFMTYRSFTTPRILLRKLIERYTIPPRLARDEKMVKTVQLRVLNALKTWVEKFWDLDTELATALLLFIDNDVRKDQHLRLADILSNTIQKRLSEMTDPGATEASLKMRTLRSKAVPKALASTPKVLVDCSEEDIANQLTLMEFAIYSSIKPSEMLGQCWAKPQLHHRAPHLMEMVNRFNSVGNWVAKCIIEPTGLKSRVKRFEKMVNIAKLLRERNNFSTMMAFLGGMNNSAVARLKWTRASLSKKQSEILSELEAQMKSEFSYKAYRELLKGMNPPAIPYLGVAMKDLTFIEDGNPDTDKEYDFVSTAGIAELVATIPAVVEKDIYNMSLQREPRDCDKTDLEP